MVRVATILKKFRAGIEEVSIDGLTTDQELATIRGRALAQIDEQTACWIAVAAAAAGRRRHPLPRAGRLHAGHRRVAGAVLQGPHLPGADAAGVRPGPSVPVHLEPQHEPRGARPPRAAAPSSRASRCRACCRASSRCRPACRRTPGVVVRVPRRRHPPQHPAAVPRHAGRGRAPLPRHPRHRHGDPGRRGRRPARDRRPRAEAAALRRAVAAAGRSRHAQARVEHPDRELRGRRGRRGAHHRSPGLRRLARALPSCTGRR